MWKETKQSGLCLIFWCCENTVYSVSVYFYSISLHIFFSFYFFGQILAYISCTVEEDLEIETVGFC